MHSHASLLRLSHVIHRAAHWLARHSDGPTPIWFDSITGVNYEQQAIPDRLRRLFGPCMSAENDTGMTLIVTCICFVPLFVSYDVNIPWGGMVFSSYDMISIDEPFVWVQLLSNTCTAWTR